MGKLVKFDCHIRPVRPAPAPQGNAQILMFTGVRYERGVLPASKGHSHPSRPKRKRV